MAKVSKTSDEWRAQLTPEQYNVTREHGTERAFSGPHGNEERSGSYDCICCGNPLFKSATKFDSGTGWPSFWAPAQTEAVVESEDRKLFMIRTEVTCANCDAHLGHLFNDGPQPSGQRYCMNGTALSFSPDDETEKLKP
jgi:peptide-methionine (R)-S-oxide reductase